MYESDRMDEMDIYGIGIVEEWVEDDEISAGEEGFITGYLDA